jgi:hypothetical protein
VNLKYTIISQDGIEVPLIFSPLLMHEYVAEKCQVISAGFCGLNEMGRWIAGGRSTSLKLGARPQGAEISNAQMGAGGVARFASGSIAAQTLSNHVSPALPTEDVQAISHFAHS